jgi:hypothetical protein
VLARPSAKRFMVPNMLCEFKLVDGWRVTAGNPSAEPA